MSAVLTGSRGGGGGGGTHQIRHASAAASRIPTPNAFLGAKYITERDVAMYASEDLPALGYLKASLPWDQYERDEKRAIRDLLTKHPKLKESPPTTGAEHQQRLDHQQQHQQQQGRRQWPGEEPRSPDVASQLETLADLPSLPSTPSRLPGRLLAKHWENTRAQYLVAAAGATVAEHRDRPEVAADDEDGGRSDVDSSDFESADDNGTERGHPGSRGSMDSGQDSDEQATERRDVQQMMREHARLNVEWRTAMARAMKCSSAMRELQMRAAALGVGDPSNVPASAASFVLDEAEAAVPFHGAVHGAARPLRMRISGLGLDPTAGVGGDGGHSTKKDGELDTEMVMDALGHPGRHRNKNRMRKEKNKNKKKNSMMMMTVTTTRSAATGAGVPVQTREEDVG